MKFRKKVGETEYVKLPNGNWEHYELFGLTVWDDHIEFWDGKKRKMDFHHINCLKDDNRKENLIKLPRGFHAWLHRDPVFYENLVYEGFVDKETILNWYNIVGTKPKGSLKMLFLSEIAKKIKEKQKNAVK